MVKDYVIRMRMGSSYLAGTEHYGGKAHKKYKYREIYRTNAGEFTPEEWKEKLEQEIHKEGLEELLEHVKIHCREHCMWVKKESEIEEYAMDCLAGRSYEHWADFQSPEGEIIWM